MLEFLFCTYILLQCINIPCESMTFIVQRGYVFTFFLNSTKKRNSLIQKWLYIMNTLNSLSSLILLLCPTAVVYVEISCRVSVNDTYDFNLLICGFHTEKLFIFRIRFWFIVILIGQETPPRILDKDQNIVCKYQI